ncbi:MAG: hypothetical protein FWE49_01700 [Synergistaceae bacterium]|nr:hypothetical protein [Synergistaceae bacterium]
MNKQEFFSFLSKSIGSKVEIINRSGINKGIYSSSLLDLKDRMIGIAQPMQRGILVQMSGIELTICVKSEGNLIEAPVISRGTTFEGFIPILWVEPIGDIVKVQRRSYVRIPCFLEASCYFLEMNSDIREPAPDIPKEWFTIFVNNVSLGGIAATVKQGYGANYHIKGRYLLAINFGGGLMFINLLLRNIFYNDDDGILNGAFAFGGLSAFQDKIIGNYVRRQELAGKNK